MLRACQEFNQKKKKWSTTIDVVLAIDRCWSIDDDRQWSQVATNVDQVDLRWKDEYIDFELDAFWASCSIHLSYLAIAFIAEAYVISYWPLVRLSLTNLSNKSNPSHLSTLVGRRLNIMRKKTKKSVQKIQTNMFEKIDVENVRLKKINTNWNRCIKFNHKSLSQSKA